MTQTIIPKKAHIKFAKAILKHFEYFWNKKVALEQSNMY